jgi:hypothetical protein
MAGTPQIMPNDYVGKTRQRGRLRENQHRDTQSFSDLIVGSPRVLWEGDCTEAELDEMERRFIQDADVRPRLNWKLNEDNPQQIPKWVQLEQRHQRDDAAGRPRWVPPDQRRRDSLLDWRSDQSTGLKPDRPVSVPRTWTALQVKALVWSCAWLITAVAIWGFLDKYAVMQTWSQRVIAGLVCAPFLIGWSLAGAPMSRRQWRKLRRRGWKRWMKW